MDECELDLGKRDEVDMNEKEYDVEWRVLGAA